MGEARTISGPLMLGLIALPIVFFWFLLRPGYARSTRIVVAVYALIFPILNIIVFALDAVTR